MSVTQAHLFHLEKNSIADDLYEMANKATNPTLRSIRYMENVWKERHHGDLTHKSMLECLQEYKESNQDITLEYNITESNFCAILVTSFMRRVGSMVRESGECVFIDATSNVDQNKIAVVPLLTSSVAGALPLAVLFLSPQDQESFTNGQFYKYLQIYIMR